MNPARLLDGRLKLRHLVLVTTIAEQGSVVRAAEQLHITQPVVTRGLRDLEAILGVELFERGPRGVSPTLVGEAFLEHARAVLAQIRQAGQHVTELNEGHVGTVTVGTHLAGSNLLLPKAILSLKRERPRVTVVVKEATPDVLAADLLAGRIDLMVGRLRPGEDGGQMAQIRLYQEPIRLVTRAGHPAQALPEPSLGELLGYPWVLPVSQTALRHELEEVFFADGLPLPRDRVECTSILTLLHLLLDSDLIAALPMLIAEEDDRLTTLPTALRSVHRLVGVTVPRDRAPSPSTRLLLEHLRQAASEIRERLTDRPTPADVDAGTLVNAVVYQSGDA
ncbi:LysR substrate-binding domain-containing protein [Pseudonocardia acaciae]|uniref:LysR substrate-binding domain-containing protein n=1 Tax=Pseudonocardia acaciae TaxID=551276 RepID=UPI0009FC7C9A|nr:LysR substrate-binding domain-containing protein [Pseudonocardia acaciae]